MKKLKFTFILLASIIVFSACSNDKAVESNDVNDDGTFTIGFVVKTMSNPYYKKMLEGAEQAAEEFGVNLKWVASEKHTDVAGQLEIVEDMIQQKVDALVINPSGPDAIVPAIEKANDSNIPVV